MFHVKPKDSRYVQIEDNNETRELGILNCYGYVIRVAEVLRFYVRDPRPSHLIGLPEIPVGVTLKGPINVEEDWLIEGVYE